MLINVTARLYEENIPKYWEGAVVANLLDRDITESKFELLSLGILT